MGTRRVRSTSIPNGITKIAPITSETELSRAMSKFPMCSPFSSCGATAPMVEVSALLSASTHANSVITRARAGRRPPGPPGRGAARRASARAPRSPRRSRPRGPGRCDASPACSSVHHRCSARHGGAGSHVTARERPPPTWALQALSAQACAATAPASSPRATSSSAICTAFSAAPLSRLSPTTNRLSENGSPRSRRIRPTATSSRPA